MPRPNLGKVPVRLSIRKDILEAARKYIPNLSDFVEGKLLEFLFYVKDPIAKNLSGLARIRTGDHRLVRAAS